MFDPELFAWADMFYMQTPTKQQQDEFKKHKYIHLLTLKTIATYLMFLQ